MNIYVKKLKLTRHVEGGYFGEFYKSTDKIIPQDKRYDSSSQSSEPLVKTRNAGSSIYFLLEKNDFSAWHRLKSDEIWHYYDGTSPIDIHVIDEIGELKTYTVGRPNKTEGASFQVVIKAGWWFAAEIRDHVGFGLAGCTVTPAFEYQDFELADRKQLVSRYPEHANIIEKFTRINESNATDKSA